MKKRILSGMRPTGKLHLGHLVGALKNWVGLQDTYESLFMVADWHALMSEYAQPQKIQEDTFDCVVDWISAGIDPKKSIIFIQSQVKEHLELAMVLGVITPLSWLERCPTYKEQLKELAGRELTTYGFLGYPVLQAADILVYKATTIPIGADQLPHLELAREIVRRFHSIYKKRLFPEPEPLMTEVPKLLGLDGRKMSKSYGNYIALSDLEETIRKKVMQMFTDPKRVKLKDPGHPEVCNIFSYFRVFKEELLDEVADYCRHAKVGCTECKGRLADLLIDALKGHRQKRKELLEEPKRIQEILDEGAERARAIASQTMNEVKALVNMA